jgi:hypothetical protein
VLAIDDKFRSRGRLVLLWPGQATAKPLAGGWGVTELTHPT